MKPIKQALRNYLQRREVWCLLALCLMMNSYCLGQNNIALGSWRVHVPYQQGKAIADAGDKVYVASEKGLFFYDKEFNTTQTITKVDGLREQQISTIAYDHATQTLIIAYTNTNLDLIRKGKIININDIFRKSISGEKRINQIHVFNNQAYIATSFGVVVLDLVKLEIKDTYSNLGPNGELVSVQASAILRDSIFLATNQGILGAKRQQVNLQDFKSWGSVNKGLPTGGVLTGLAAFNNELFVSTNSGIYTWRQSWQKANWSPNSLFSNLSSSSDYLTIISGSQIYTVDKSGKVSILTHALISQPKDAVVTPTEAKVWVADNQKGLVRLNLAGTEADVFTPNGPSSSNSFRVYANDGKVYVLSGGFSQAYLQNGSYEGFYTFSDGIWESFNRALYPTSTFLNVNDIVDATFNPITKKLYVASYGKGLIEWEGPDKGKLYNGLNSPLLSALSSTDKTEFIRITDLAVDKDGSVWVVNRNQATNAPGLHVLQKDGNWKSYVLPGVPDGSNLDQIVIDDLGQKWLSIARRANKRGGLVVFDEKGNKVRMLSVGDGLGGLPNATVHALAKDQLGDIWVATAGGVGVYYNPAIVFSSSQYDARIPIIDRRPLLDGQVVRSIAVDGANRKWMATDNGLWLFNPEGDKLIKHFTTANSPLPSDKVLSVAVEYKSGEVFVATDAGVASYRAEATVTEGTPDCAMVYPNPVRASYTGLIGVSGLPNNADVRITDVAGSLVYKTKATGGSLAWDARDYNGKRVKAGVYLVMSSSEDAQQTCISKIAILD